MSNSTASGAEMLDHFLDLCCTEIERRAQLAEPEPGVLCQGAAAFRGALQAMPAGGPASSPLASVPAVSYLRELQPSPSVPPSIAQAAAGAAVDIPWIATPRLKDDDGQDVALGIIDQVRSLGELQCGLMLMAPGAAYPEHAHPPQEIYLPIAGDGHWRFGGSADYRTLDADALIYNNPRDLHGAVATDDALLALYILWP